MNLLPKAKDMITKESLIEARESINEATLQIKQQYPSSNETKKILFVVEGKDDVTYYGVKTTKYQQAGFKVSIISAGNREKVIAAYDQLDWTIYSKSRILFVVDRDLSDYTLERTPQDENIYVTDKYSIENELCSFMTFLNTLKFYCGMNDIDDSDEEELKKYYSKLNEEFYNIIDPIMGLILYWKLNSIKANYANINCNNIIRISETELTISDTLKNNDELLKYVFKQSDVTYDDKIDLAPYIAQLKAHFSPDHYVRGKYLLCFFVCMINYVARKSDVILNSKRKGKMTINVGQADAISKLCALMPIPQTLNDFFEKRFNAI